MAVDWMGGDPNTPDYYIYVRNVELKYSFLKRIFVNKKTYTEKKVSIITSSEFYKLNKEDRKFYKGMTIRDVEEHGTEDFKKQLPRAKAQVLGRIMGFPF